MSLASPRTVIPMVMVCHFIAAFAALGMPPFFALILEDSLHSDATYLAGWFYVVPTFFAALSSPWWGKLADRFGKKPLLIRAQLGLSASFLLAGFAPNVWVFLLALVLQGALGGTFAASNAYIATVVNGSALTRSLTAMQWSARAALVAAPVCFGLWIGAESPLVLYRYLALLPLVAAALMWGLPEFHSQHPPKKPNEPPEEMSEATPVQIYALQFAFVFATVITFPYFVSHVQQRFVELTAAQAGLLFGLPHFVYLAAAPLLSRWLVTRWRLITVGVAFAALTTSLFGQFATWELDWLVAWRIAMGIGMTAGFIGLHALMAGIVRSHSAGRTFGWFEGSSKWGAVGAGLVAGGAVLAGPALPFLIGAIAAAMAAGYIALISLTAPVIKPRDEENL